MRNRRFLAAGLLVVTAAVSFATWATGPASGTQGHLQKLTVYAFDINKPADELIPAPGTTPGVVSVGDIHIVNDQLTSTTLNRKSGYPIIGFSSGSCTVTRVSPDGQAKGSPFNAIYSNCTVTATLPHGSVVAQGVLKQSATTPLPGNAGTLAVTGGTGIYAGVKGTVALKFGQDFLSLTFQLQ
jgi:hypothetical protein